MQMIRDLFINFMIIVASITLANLLLRDHIFANNLRNNLINGLLAGLLGCAVMLFGATAAPGIFIDFRYIPIIVMAIYFAPIAALETALIIGLFRILYFGLSDASLTAAVISLFFGFVCSLVSRMKISRKIKWLLCVVVLFLMTFAGLFFLVRLLDNRWLILGVFEGGTLVGSMLMYFITEYLSNSNRYYEKLKNEAEMDHLTGLKNTRFFDLSINRAISEAISVKRKVSLLFIDIDLFKKVNDKYGHSVGDRVLQDLGGILRQVARTHDIITRKGGDEFTILLIDCSLDHAIHAAERVRKTVEEYEFRVASHELTHITVSIGVSAFPETAAAEDRLIEQADIALYQAKREGRNKTVSAPVGGFSTPVSESPASAAVGPSTTGSMR